LGTKTLDVVNIETWSSVEMPDHRAVECKRSRGEQQSAACLIRCDACVLVQERLWDVGTLALIIGCNVLVLSRGYQRVPEEGHPFFEDIKSAVAGGREQRPARQNVLRGTAA